MCIQVRCYAANLCHISLSGGDCLEILRDCIGKIRHILAFLKPMRIQLHSAYTCFFLILSLFPGLLLFLGLLRYTSLGVEDLMALLSGFLPDSLLPMVQTLASASYRHSSGLVVSVSVVAALYSASRGMFGILGGLLGILGCLLNGLLGILESLFGLRNGLRRSLRGVRNGLLHRLLGIRHGRLLLFGSALHGFRSGFGRFALSSRW